jgi:hypothetical protein
MKKTNYWNVFCKIKHDAKSFTVSQALNIPQAESQELLDRIENEIKRQETLLALIHQKSDLDDEKIQEIEKLKALRISKKTTKTKKGEGKIERLVRLRYFYEIEKLRKAGFSWRTISEYLMQNHKKNIHFTTLRKAFEKISQQINQQQN